MNDGQKVKIRRNSIQETLTNIRRTLYNKTNKVNKSKKRKEISKFVFANENEEVSNSKSKDAMKQGIVDCIGFCGCKDVDIVSQSFYTPFSISLKHIPSILSNLSGFEETALPNKLEWFCFPNGIHYQRPVPSFILQSVPSYLIQGLEYVITCLPCSSLFVSAGDTPIDRMSEITYIMKEEQCIPNAPHVYINLKAIESYDITPEEMLDCLHYQLCQRTPIISSSLQKIFLRISFDEIEEDYIPKLVVNMIRSNLKSLDRDDHAILYYIVSFINLYIITNKDLPIALAEENDDEDDASSVSVYHPSCEVEDDSDENESFLSCMKGKEKSINAYVLKELAEYYYKMGFKYRCLFDLDVEDITNGIEEVSQFFFECLFQPNEGGLTRSQQNALYSIFLIIVLHYKEIFDVFLRIPTEEHPKQAAKKEEDQPKKMFCTYPCPSCYYSLLFNGSVTDYCCCYITYKQTSCHVYYPRCLFVLTATPCPLSICAILPHLFEVFSKEPELQLQVMHFLLYDCYQPIPSTLDVSFRLNDQLCVLSSVNTHDRLMNTSILPYLFELLPLESIVNILLLLLLDEKILLVSSQFHLLPMILEGLVLLLPYTWPHAVIPVVPYYLLPILIDSPSPFIFGASASTFSNIRDRIPQDVNVIYLNRECKSYVSHIPNLPRKWLISSLSALDTSLPPSTFYFKCKQAVYSFYWLLLPSFSKYIYTFLGNVCFFNNMDYLNNEVEYEFKGYYERLLSTQSFAMFTDHFWNEKYKSFIGAMISFLSSDEAGSSSSVSSPSLLEYPPLPFSARFEISALEEVINRVDESTLQSIKLSREHYLIIEDALSGMIMSQSPMEGSVKETKVFEVFSHPIMSAINKLLIQYLIGSSPQRYPFFEVALSLIAYRSKDVLDYVIEGFTERNVRNDFMRILYQPHSLISSFKVLSLSAASSLAYLFSSFYSNCVKQRDYRNALKLHKTASIMIVHDAAHPFPLYGFLYAHEIYTKVGFWKELLVDYCNSYKEHEAAYSMQYSCLENSHYDSIRIPTLAELTDAETGAALSDIQRNSPTGEGECDEEVNEDVQITNRMTYKHMDDSGNAGCINEEVEDESDAFDALDDSMRFTSLLTSSTIVSKALCYLSDLMIDLRLSDDFANQIISAIIRLINR